MYLLVKFKIGYLGVPPDCTEVTVCSSHPCQNGGICGLLPNGQFNCSCSSGYTGIYIIYIIRYKNLFL